MPLLRLFRRKTFFYCHFPDKLLATHAALATSLLRRAYRLPFDLLEELCTGAATRVLVRGLGFADGASAHRCRFGEALQRS